MLCFAWDEQVNGLFNNTFVIKGSLFRQKIYDAHILDTIKPFLGENSPIDVMRETLSVCRGLVLDDDVRVEFGRAHEHARVIASETLCPIMALLSSEFNPFPVNIS